MYRQIYEKESKSAEGAVASQEQVLSDEVAEKLNLESAPVEGENSEEKKHQSRGGKGLQRDEGAKLDKEALKRAVSHKKSFPFLIHPCRRLDYN